MIGNEVASSQTKQSDKSGFGSDDKDSSAFLHKIWFMTEYSLDIRVLFVDVKLKISPPPPPRQRFDPPILICCMLPFSLPK
jgi:hypothetical protein